MNKKAFAALAFIGAALTTQAQSAIDAYNLSQSEMRGTARFMSMGGAFTALGGDLSTLNQNPGGIGIFRKHELGITVDLSFSDSKSETDSWGMTKFYCNNFGYVGAVELDSDIMPYFQFGASYGRSMSFDRQYAGGWSQLGTSMSNYVANFSNGYSPSTLGQSSGYNPYDQSRADWMSILSYNSYLINPTGGDNYKGLWEDGVTSGNSYFNVRERGYVDEYNITFGGNFADVVYWGMGFGITDLQYTVESNYDEELSNANIASSSGGSQIQNGNAYFNLGNFSHTTGAGFNYKIGFIFKPIQEFRLGIALHTPTYYNMSTEYDARVDYSYSSRVGDGTAYSDIAYYEWDLRTPLKFMVGAAGVIGNSAIVSVDYEYQASNDMRVSSPSGLEYKDVTDDIKYYYKPTHTVRVGLEYRLSRNFSLRAGYSTTTSGVADGAMNGDDYIYTAGTNPAYTFNSSTRYITGGLGYRSGGFYADLAYVNKYTKSTYSPFSSFNESYFDGDSWCYSPYSNFTTSNNNIVLSLGYKF